MKYVYLPLAGLFLLSAFTSTQSTYETAVKKGIEQLYSAENLQDMQATANLFHRIAQTEKEKWLPPYYEALTYAFMSFNRTLEDGERDFYLDKADKLQESLADKQADPSEEKTLEGFIKMAKLSVSPMLRGPLMSRSTTACFEKAVALDPNNPRALGMLARMKYGTASFFGSSKDESCTLAKKAVVLYDKEQETKRGILPTWGRSMTASLAKSCGEKEE